jgi:hypothetical protein
MPGENSSSMVEVISDRHTPLASCRQYSGREGFSLKLFLCVCAGVVPASSHKNRYVLGFLKRRAMDKIAGPTPKI